MAVLQDKDKILSFSKRKKKLINVPEWGEGAQVWIQEISAAERDAYEQSLTRVKQNGNRTSIEPYLINSKARFAVKCIVDEKGDRIFGDNDAIKLGQIGSAALSRIVEEGTKLSGMSREDIEDLSGNLSNDQSEDSPSS